MNTRYAQAAPPRGREGIAVYQRIEGALARLAEKMGAAPMQYPVLIARDALVRAGYPDAFAHLLMMGANLRSPELIGEGQLEPGNLASPQWCLSPAVCYHVYAGFTGQTLDGPRVVTAGDAVSGMRRRWMRGAGKLNSRCARSCCSGRRIGFGGRPRREASVWE